MDAIPHANAAPANDLAPLRVGQAPVGPPAAACASTTIESWTGDASRASDQYPDDIEAAVTWRRVGTTGCVDRYAPSGEAHYHFAIPGALCRQTVTPDSKSVAAGEGTLTVDRSTSPATYTMHGATTWSVTWTCTRDDGSTDTMTFDAGGLWVDASGTVGAGSIAGSTTQPDGLQCGQGNSTLPCTYTWSFTAAP
ncbi:MAG TPA: hypothetical protein VHE35_20905 [Kofleriaceae bacterium]|nr:hypothetical protein [Kofleriaceae bacterium]